MRISCLIPLFLVCLAAACGKPQGQDASALELTVLIGTDGYGDGCYNDNMLQGIVGFCDRHPEVKLSLQQPGSIADAGKRLDAWLAAESTAERALLLASNSYEPILRGKAAPNNGRVLILEDLRNIFSGTVTDRTPAVVLATHTTGSHAGLYNDACYGNVYRSTMTEYLKPYE